MAQKEIIWSLRAHKNRLEILDYWIQRNTPKTYSERLFSLFNQAALLIAKHPQIGKPTSIPGVRFKIVRDNLMFFRKMKSVEILFI